MERSEFDKIANDIKILSSAGATVTDGGWTSYIATRIGNSNYYITLSENEKPQRFAHGVLTIRNLEFNEISQKHIFDDHPYMFLYEKLKEDLDKTKEERFPHLPEAVKEKTLLEVIEEETRKKGSKLRMKPQKNFVKSMDYFIR